jgi:hypothetical protein
MARKPKRSKSRVESKAKANKGRRTLITGGMVWAADKAAGGIIGKGAITLLSKLAPAASGPAIVSGAGIALGAAYVIATGDVVMQAYPPHVMVTGPDGVCERNFDVPELPSP